MKNTKTKFSGLCLAVVGLGLWLVATPASASQRIFQPGSSCATDNCAALTWIGTYDFDNSNADPVVYQLHAFGGTGRCLRVEVTSSSADLEIVVISPDGSIWRDDDGGVGLLPRVEAVLTGEPSGWYTVQVSHFSGGGAYSDFTIAYGQYTGAGSTVNCAVPTTKLAAPAKQ